MFAGISPKLKGEYFGLTSEFGLGVFSYKDYYTSFNNTTDPSVEIEAKKTTYGPGAMSSLGFYVKVGRFGINPNVNAFFSGGASGSFLFYGASLPITFQF